MDEYQSFSTAEQRLMARASGVKAPISGSMELLPLCNMNCKMCYVRLSPEEMKRQGNLHTWEEWLEAGRQMQRSGVLFLLLTGGEPLIQKEIAELLQLLGADDSLLVHIETNGSVDIAPFKNTCQSRNILYILDYKLPESGMENQMCMANLNQVQNDDVYKFVIASEEDLNRAVEIVKAYDLQNRCQVFFSPVREMIEPLLIVDKMKDECLNGVRLQLQLHKILWPKEMRGV